MLQQILNLFRRSRGRPLSRDAIAVQLGVPPPVVEQMLRTLVQRGRLVEVEEACTGCDICPLHSLCAGAPTITTRGYALAEPVSPPSI